MEDSQEIDLSMQAIICFSWKASEEFSQFIGIPSSRRMGISVGIKKQLSCFMDK